jgi:hypothetical protein
MLLTNSASCLFFEGLFSWWYVTLQDDHVESDDDLTQKIRLFLNKAVNAWDADFYVKMDDNIGLNLGEVLFFSSVLLLLHINACIS